MKELLGIFFIVLVVGLVSCTNEDKEGEKQALSVIWKDAPVLGAVIRIEREAIESWQEGSESDSLPLPFGQDKQPVLAQHWDRDQDGSWDYLLMDTTDLQKIHTFNNIASSSISQYNFPKHTNVHLGKGDSSDVFQAIQEEVRPTDHIKMQTGNYLYQAEGPIWENELVGFRLYFDERNGMDIFGKQQPEIAGREIGVRGNYHELQTWGMDVLKVGSSLGAGALGIVLNDTLKHLGDAEKETFKILENGPLMSSFKIEYENLNQLEGSKIIRNIFIFKGLAGYIAENTISSDYTEASLATGIVNLHSDSLMVQKENGYVLLTTHGPQAELDKYLGMGLVITEDQLVAYDTAPKEGAPVTNTYYAILDNKNEAVSYLFLAGWELQDAQNTDVDYFNEKSAKWATQFVEWIK